MKKVLSLSLLLLSTCILANVKLDKEFPKICELTCTQLGSLNSNAELSSVIWDSGRRYFYLYSKGLPFPNTMEISPKLTILHYGGQGNGTIIFPEDTPTNDLSLLPNDFRGMMMSSELLTSMVDVDFSKYRKCSIDMYFTHPDDGRVYTQPYDYETDTMVDFKFSPLKLTGKDELQRDKTRTVNVITEIEILQPKAKSNMSHRLQELKNLGVCR